MTSPDASDVRGKQRYAKASAETRESPAFFVAWPIRILSSCNKDRERRKLSKGKAIFLSTWPSRTLSPLKDSERRRNMYVSRRKKEENA